MAAGGGPLLRLGPGRQLDAYLRERLAAGAVIYPPRPLRALEETPLAAGARRHPRPGPVPRSRPGRGAGVLGGAGRQAAAVAAQHLQGAGLRHRPPAAGHRIAAALGAARRAAAQHQPHRRGRRGRQPCEEGLGGCSPMRCWPRWRPAPAPAPTCCGARTLRPRPASIEGTWRGPTGARRWCCKPTILRRCRLRAAAGAFPGLWPFRAGAGWLAERGHPGLFA
jgi:hypothetical protein